MYVNKVADMNSDRSRSDWMQWKPGAPTQNVPIPRGEARKGGAQKEGGFRRLSPDEFGWSRTDDSINLHDRIATRWAERWCACGDS